MIFLYNIPFETFPRVPGLFIYLRFLRACRKFKFPVDSGKLKSYFFCKINNNIYSTVNHLFNQKVEYMYREKYLSRLFKRQTLCFSFSPDFYYL